MLFDQSSGVRLVASTPTPGQCTSRSRTARRPPRRRARSCPGRRQHAVLEVGEDLRQTSSLGAIEAPRRARPRTARRRLTRRRRGRRTTPRPASRDATSPTRPRAGSCRASRTDQVVERRRSRSSDIRPPRPRADEDAGRPHDVVSLGRPNSRRPIDVGDSGSPNRVEQYRAVEVAHSKSAEWHERHVADAVGQQRRQVVGGEGLAAVRHRRRGHLNDQQGLIVTVHATGTSTCNPIRMRTGRSPGHGPAAIRLAHRRPRAARPGRRRRRGTSLPCSEHVPTVDLPHGSQELVGRRSSRARVAQVPGELGRALDVGQYEHDDARWPSAPLLQEEARAVPHHRQDRSVHLPGSAR